MSLVIQSIVGKTGVFSVPIATILGIPMYGSCAAIVPIAVVLFQKGIPLGTALAFMMAIAALSLPVMSDNYNTRLTTIRIPEIK
ncbi:MAG: permease [Elusimicrobia bacterium]|nr:permease [Elusimicrobiota bacterium]